MAAIGRGGYRLTYGESIFDFIVEEKQVSTQKQQSIDDTAKQVRIVDDSIQDYKFFCFNGVVKCFKIDFDRFIEHHANYYDIHKNLLPFGEIVCPPQVEKAIKMPDSIEKMMDLAQNLSKDIPFLRVDFYDVNGQIYFGECTFFPASGFGAFTSKTWDDQLGEWLVLEKEE